MDLKPVLWRYNLRFSKNLRKWNYKDSKAQKEIHKKIGLVFQTFNLFPHMNILENLILSPIHTLNLSLEEALKKHYKFFLNFL